MLADANQAWRIYRFIALPLKKSIRVSFCKRLPALFCAHKHFIGVRLKGSEDVGVYPVFLIADWMQTQK